MRVAGLELIKLSHISLDICLCCPSLEYIKMELHKFNSTKFLMNTQQPSKLNTKTKRNTNFSIPALEVPLLPRSYDCLVDVWKVSGLRLRAASGAKGYFGWIKFTCQNNTNSVMLTQYHFNVKKFNFAPRPSTTKQGGIKCGNRGTGFLDSKWSHQIQIYLPYL